MIQIVTIENPFELTKKIENVEYTGKSITNYVDVENKDIYINGLIALEPSTTYPLNGDQLIVMPHIAGGGLKKVLGFVAMIALSVYAGNVGGGLWGTHAGVASGVWGGGVGAALASGAVMYLGGRLINAIFPQNINNIDNDWKDNYSDPTYGWDLPTPTTREGDVIGETYGECIPTPQLLEQHVETFNDKQYLNLLYCGGYGTVDEISNIRIGSTDISNFTEVQIETRLGTNDQEPISFFTDTPLDQAVSLELELNKPLIRTSDSIKAVALEVTIEFPGGLYHLNDDGSYASTTVEFIVKYRKKDTAEWLSNGTNFVVTGAQNSALRRAYKITGLEANQYDVRVECITKPTGSRYCTTAQWTIMTSYDAGIYSRPNKVLVAMRILASNQLSGGTPSVNWRQKRNTVWVWNPNINKYEAKPANNPVWASYDIMHCCKMLKNINTGQFEYVVEGTAKENLIKYYDQWVEAANYAWEMIKNQDGELEHRFEFDAYFNSSEKRMTAAQKAAAVGHATIIPHGKDYGIIVDKPGEICQIFGEGRTSVSSVNGTFTSKSERATSIEITYNDSQNDFKNTLFMMRSPSSNELLTEDNTAQLTLFGVKRRSQAYREGITALATNERQLQFIELDADVNAMVAEYGDIVGYNHTVSQIGIASGRIVSATNTTVELDKEVDLDAELSYEIYIQFSSNDKIQKRNIVPETAVTRVLKLSSPFDELPQKYDNYSFGEVGKAVKPFRIVSAGRSSDLLCSLKLAEYDEAIYSAELDYSKYPVIDYTPPSQKIKIRNLELAEETYVNTAGVATSILHIHWGVGRYQEIDKYNIYLSTDGLNYNYYATTLDIGYAITNVKAAQNYWIKIIPIKMQIYGESSIASIYITGKDTPPHDVSSISIVQNNLYLDVLITENDEPDIDYYELRQGLNWATGVLVGTFSGNRYSFLANDEGTQTFWIKAVDTSKNYSLNARKAMVNVSNLPKKNIIYTQGFKPNDLIAENMYIDNFGELCAKSNKPIGELQLFADMFDLTDFSQDRVAYLPTIDLGPNIVDPDCYYIDAWGIIHINSEERIENMSFFADMFSDTVWHEMAAKSLASTFMRLDVISNANDSILITQEYRTSIDNINWTSWTPAIQKQFAGRYIQIRLTCKSVTGHDQIKIKGVNISIDVPDVDEIIENITLHEGLNHIEFKHTFMNNPKSVAVFTTDLTGKSVTWQTTNITPNSCDLEIFDDNEKSIPGKLVKAFIGGY